MTASNADRPFRQRARELCTEAVHLDGIECELCRALELRLTPVSTVLADLLDDADLTLEVGRP